MPQSISQREGAWGVEVARRGPGVAKARQTAHITLNCLLTESDDNRFDEAAFLNALRLETRKEIESNGAAIVENEIGNSRDFSIDYQDKSYKGRITIAGSRRGQYYSLRAKIDEESL
jgi:hypothetical protein